MLSAGRSREGAWIEIALFCLYILYQTGRSREGAWIEIWIKGITVDTRKVAPVRERGLKFDILCLGLYLRSGRSREGAWIEIGRLRL